MNVDAKAHMFKNFLYLRKINIMENEKKYTPLHIAIIIIVSILCLAFVIFLIVLPAETLVPLAFIVFCVLGGAKLLK